jgi:hypothetical protein
VVAGLQTDPGVVDTDAHMERPQTRVFPIQNGLKRVRQNLAHRRQHLGHPGVRMDGDNLVTGGSRIF